MWQTYICIIKIYIYIYTYMLHVTFSIYRLLGQLLSIGVSACILPGSPRNSVCEATSRCIIRFCSQHSSTQLHLTSMCSITDVSTLVRSITLFVHVFITVFRWETATLPSTNTRNNVNSIYLYLILVGILGSSLKCFFFLKKYTQLIRGWNERWNVKSNGQWCNIYYWNVQQNIRKNKITFAAKGRFSLFS